MENSKNYKEGSHPHQVIELNKRIEALTLHLKDFKKDNIAKVSLFRLVSKKKRFLKYIKRTNPEAYEFLRK